MTKPLNRATLTVAEVQGLLCNGAVRLSGGFYCWLFFTISSYFL